MFVFFVKWILSIPTLYVCSPLHRGNRSPWKISEFLSPFLSLSLQPHLFEQRAYRLIIDKHYKIKYIKTSIRKIYKYSSFEKIKYVWRTLDIKCLTPILWQDHLETSYSRWVSMGRWKWRRWGCLLEGMKRFCSDLLSHPHSSEFWTFSKELVYNWERQGRHPRLSSKQGDQTYN